MRQSASHRGLVTAALLLSTVLFGATDARCQGADELLVDPESGIAIMPWDQLELGFQVDEPVTAIVIQDEAVLGELVPLREGLAYVPSDEFWTAGGDSFTYSFDVPGRWFPPTSIVVSWPFETFVEDDMESQAASPWFDQVGDLSFVDDGIRGRSLEVVASSIEERFLEADLALLFGQWPFQGTTTQNTETTMTVDVDDPDGHDPPGGAPLRELVIWSASSPVPIATRLRLRNDSGGLALRAESDTLAGDICATDWLPITPSVPSRVSISVLFLQAGGQLALEIEAPLQEARSSVVDYENAAIVDFVEHRLGAMEVVGLDGLRFLVDDFRTGEWRPWMRRMEIADDFEAAAFDDDWELAWAAETQLDSKLAMSGVQGVSFDVAAMNSTGLSYEVPAPTDSLSVKMRVDPNELKLVDGAVVAVLEASEDPRFPSGSRLVELLLRQNAGTSELRVRTLDDERGTVESPWVPLPPGSHSVVTSWKASAGGGVLVLWIDGTPAVTLRGFVNGSHRIAAVRFGAFGFPPAAIPVSGPSPNLLAVDSLAIWR